MSNKKLADRLDWSAMLGFEQVVDSRGSLRAGTQQRLGAKVGGKPGLKAGTKPTIRIGHKIGVKTGQKAIGQI